MPDEQPFSDFLETLRDGMNRPEADILAARAEVERIDAELASRRPKLAVDNSAEPPGPLALRPLSILQQKDIPHRQWLYGTHLIRGFVTLLVAPGGTGKSSLILAIAMALATNRKLLRMHIHQRCRVALLNLEDPQHEIDRRVAALAQYYNVSNADLDGHLFISPEERKIVIAQMSEDGFSIVYPDEDAIIRSVRANQIDVLCVDPFAESHALEENSNPQMVRAAAAWRRIAHQCNCSVLLAHHVRKGPMDSIESARGAKALTDSARVGLLLTPMAKEEAQEFNIPEDERGQYVRLDDAKVNLAKRAGKANWFKLSDVTLDNAQEPYRTGDEVGVVEAFEPPNAWDGMSTDEANSILDQIAAGPAPGALYTDSRRHPATRWAGHVVMKANGHSAAQADTIIKTWLRNGVLTSVEYHDTEQRKLRTGLQVVDANRPGPRHA